jgi:hypothetical protein
MELYCIKTHSQKVVVEGNIYPLISDKMPCKCNDGVDVGVKAILKAKIRYCQYCKTSYQNDGIWWIGKVLFANIDDISISEATEQLNEKVFEELTIK